MSAKKTPQQGDHVNGDKLVNGDKIVNNQRIYINTLLIGETVGQRIVRMLISVAFLAAGTGSVFIFGPSFLNEVSNLPEVKGIAIPKYALDAGSRKLVEHLYLIPDKKDFWEIARAMNHAQAINIWGGCVMLLAGLYLLLVIQIEWHSPTRVPRWTTIRKAWCIWRKSRAEYQNRIKVARNHRACADIYIQERDRAIHAERAEAAKKHLAELARLAAEAKANEGAKK